MGVEKQQAAARAIIAITLEPVMIFKIVGFGVFDGRSRRDILPGIGAEVPTLLDGWGHCQAFPALEIFGLATRWRYA
jgi:hypothetical protein